MQTGKGLRLAKVVFNNNSKEHNLRLGSSNTQSKKSVSAKQSSPTKETPDEVWFRNKIQETNLFYDQKTIIESHFRHKHHKILLFVYIYKNRKNSRACLIRKLLNLSSQARSSDEENECSTRRKTRQVKTPRKRKVPKQKAEKTPQASKSLKLEQLQTEQQPRVAPSEPTELQQTEPNTGTTLKEESKTTTEELMEWDCNTSVESIEIKPSPERSAESESGKYQHIYKQTIYFKPFHFYAEFCEESSQDNMTDCEESIEETESIPSIHSENSNSNPCDETSWTREEDKIILETFQREGRNKEVFEQIATILKSRSSTQIKQRFQILLNLLQQMKEVS